MKISICIPQYNGIKFLLESLRQIEKQSYSEVEVVITDDCSLDNTQSAITELISSYKYPIVYFRHPANVGYDRNLRSSIEHATGDYVILIGNDDTINPDYDLSELVKFLDEHDRPEVGYTSFLDAGTGEVEKRAVRTEVLGGGTEVAASSYSRFSFVGGVIYKRDTYMIYNTAKYDKSVYTQIYHACIILAKGGRLFSITEPVVIKDILPNENRRASYTDVIAKTWKGFKKADGGLPSVIRVLIGAFDDAGVLNQKITYTVIRKIYATTLPYWMFNYRSKGAFPEALGIMLGMSPGRLLAFSQLHFLNRIKVYSIYYTFSTGALIIPVSLFEKFKVRLWHKANPVPESAIG